MASQVHVNPRYRAYGKARLDIARRAQTREEWETLWKPARFDFPFTWGRYWKQCIEYRVEDYAAEVGFYIDVLGFPVNAFNPEYAQFTSPDGEFFIAVVPAYGDLPVTPPESITLQFMVAQLAETVAELEKRGVNFDQDPGPLQPGSRMLLASFRTPHGIAIELWGEQATAQQVSAPVQKSDLPASREISNIPRQGQPPATREQPTRNSGWSPAAKNSSNAHLVGIDSDEIKSESLRMRTLPTSNPPKTGRQPTGRKTTQPPKFIPPAVEKVSQAPVSKTTSPEKPSNDEAGYRLDSQVPRSEITSPGNDFPPEPLTPNLPLPLEVAGGETHPGYNTGLTRTTSNLPQKKRTYKVAGPRPLLVRNPH